MNFLEFAQSRYTTKMYDAKEKISAHDIEQLKQILRLSPSSINSQPWKFIFVTDDLVKSSLAEVSFFNEPKIKNASLLVVFTAIDNLSNFEIQIQKSLPQGALSYYQQNIKPRTESEIKSWLQHQVYLSLGFFLAATALLGIDSTPMEGITTSAYDEILKLDGYKTLFAVAIGKRHIDDANQPSITPKSRLPIDDTIISI